MGDGNVDAVSQGCLQVVERHTTNEHVISQGKKLLLNDSSFCCSERIQSYHQGHVRSEDCYTISAM